MGVLSGILNSFAESQFAKDESGRVVFLPRGPRRLGYYVGSDESRFKPVVKMYGLAATLINLTGSTASFAFLQALTFDQRSGTLASRLRFALVVYAISATILYIGPALLLWSVYRGVVTDLCSSLPTVEPGSVSLVNPALSQRRTVVLVCVALALVLALGIFAAVSYRR